MVIQVNKFHHVLVIICTLAVVRGLRFDYCGATAVVAGNSVDQMTIIGLTLSWWTEWPSYSCISPSDASQHRCQLAILVLG